MLHNGHRMLFVTQYGCTLLKVSSAYANYFSNYVCIVLQLYILIKHMTCCAVIQTENNYISQQAYDNIKENKLFKLLQIWISEF
jgi:hypothetical protein